MKVKRAIRRAIATASRNESVGMLSPIINWCRSLPRPRPSRPSTRLAPTMNPRPPIWIRIRMISWPNQFQCVAVSSVTSPVTERADIAVKSASVGAVDSPLLLTQGNISRPVPATTSRLKTATKRRAWNSEVGRRTGGRGGGNSMMRVGSIRRRTTLSPGRPEGVRRGSFEEYADCRSLESVVAGNSERCWRLPV